MFLLSADFLQKLNLFKKILSGITSDKSVILIFYQQLKFHEKFYNLEA